MKKADDQRWNDSNVTQSIRSSLHPGSRKQAIHVFAA